MTFDLNLHAYRLLREEPFFAALSRKIEKRATTAIPTAGVTVNPETAQFEMAYNPEWFASLPEKQVLGVLKHEFYHLIFEHVTSRMPEGCDPRAWNVAADLAINSHLIGEIPENGCIPGFGPYVDSPAGKSAEWYYANMPSSEEQQQGNSGKGDDSSDGDDGSDGDDSSDGSDSDDSQGNGQPTADNPGNFDDHSGWADGDASEMAQAANEMAKERLRQALKEAAQEASKSSNGWGSVGADLKKDIMNRLETKVDWRKVLRYFIRTSQRASKTSTIRRINRRYAYIHPGKKVKRQANIAIAIDQSGSVADEMLEKFFAELNKLSKLATFTVVPFDTDVQDNLVYEWKKGRHRKAERVMCGGTCFNAPTDYVNKAGNFDGVIILTDMEAAAPKACKAQRMWMTDERGANRPYFRTKERVIVID
jgi:predicted metal-dependent peptidase